MRLFYFFILPFLSKFFLFPHLLQGLLPRLCGIVKLEERTGRKMKKWTIYLFTLLLLFCLPVGVLAESYLVPGGQLLGITVEDGSFVIAGFDSRYGQAAKESGLCVGDKILKANHKAIASLADLTDALNRADGNILLTVCRGNKELEISLFPQITPEGPRLGVYLKEGISGVGTLTYYNPEDSSFGALGHGVSNPGGGLAQITGGCVYDGCVLSVRKGKSGNPGQLMGCVTDPTPKGEITKNTPYGVFGTLNGFEKSLALEVGSYKEVKPGKATIRCTVTGCVVGEYEVEIVKVYGNKQESGRNMLIKITDPSLLDATGGIVQGMSGSPIIQDGKLIGAITHVLVNDPTQGYGIFIENMLNVA